MLLYTEARCIKHCFSQFAVEVLRQKKQKNKVKQINSGHVHPSKRTCQLVQQYECFVLIHYP